MLQQAEKKPLNVFSCDPDITCTQALPRVGCEVQSQCQPVHGRQGRLCPPRVINLMAIPPDGPAVASGHDANLGAAEEGVYPLTQIL